MLVGACAEDEHASAARASAKVESRAPRGRGRRACEREQKEEAIGYPKHRINFENVHNCQWNQACWKRAKDAESMHKCWLANARKLR